MYTGELKKQDVERLIERKRNKWQPSVIEMIERKLENMEPDDKMNVTFNKICHDCGFAAHEVPFDMAHCPDCKGTWPDKAISASQQQNHLVWMTGVKAIRKAIKRRNDTRTFS